MKRVSALGAIALVGLLILECLYLVQSVLNARIAPDNYTITVQLERSGGLMDTSPVTVRGVQVGEVASIEPVSDGLQANLVINKDTQIPIDAPGVISNLSVVGEQFLDFRPNDKGGEHFKNGDVVPKGQVRSSSTIGETVSRVTRITDAMDPKYIKIIVDALHTGLAPSEEQLSTIDLASKLLAQTILDKQNALSDHIRDSLMVISGAEEINVGKIFSDASSYVIPLSDSFTYADRLDPRNGAALARVGELLSGGSATELPDFNKIFESITQALMVLQPFTSPLRANRTSFNDEILKLLGYFTSDGQVRVPVSVPR
ncbi:MAG: MlaD family protein [Mycobacteriaceae bacterium]